MSEIDNAELYTVAPDEVVVTFTTEPDVEVTTRVGAHTVTTTGPYHHARGEGLDADTTYDLAVGDAAPSDLCPVSVTTLPLPPGELRARFATVNDVHFGELVCGLLGSAEELGPVFSVADGDTPYPEVMNRGAIAEIAAGDFDAVVVKGDLTAEGTEAEYEQFLAAYGALGARMRHVRGNHDADKVDTIATTGPFTVELPGASLAVLDTVIPHQENGRVSSEQLAWLDELAAATSGPVLVFGHHHPWDPASDERSARYFGINPDDSDALCAVIAGHHNIAGYFAGHTHRNRTRHFATARGVPIVEVACVKDYPGAWAEYRVYDGGYVQIGRRISAPDAMHWTEQTRRMYAGLYRDYALGTLADRCFTYSF
ncbi:MAG TPA: metallophosphoesterase [Acidimicrobiia bacterium]